MRTFSFLKGKKAVLSATRKSIGKVEDVLTDSGGNVLGFILCGNSLFFRRSYLPYASARIQEEDSVLICSCRPSRMPSNSDGTFRMERHPCCLLKQALLSKDGETEAVVEDVYFSENWGRIVAIEVSKGLFSDWTDGRSLIYSHEPLHIGKQSLFVR